MTNYYENIRNGCLECRVDLWQILKSQTQAIYLLKLFSFSKLEKVQKKA